MHSLDLSKVMHIPTPIYKIDNQYISSKSIASYIPNPSRLPKPAFYAFTFGDLEKVDTKIYTPIYTSKNADPLFWAYKESTSIYTNKLADIAPTLESDGYVRQ